MIPASFVLLDLLLARSQIDIGVSHLSAITEAQIWPTISVNNNIAATLIFSGFNEDIMNINIIKNSKTGTNNQNKSRLI